MNGKHRTNKPYTDPTYDAQWSGVSYAPHCPNGCTCPHCGAELHVEGDGHYCPVCDNFRRPTKGCNATYTDEVSDYDTQP